MNPLLPWIVLGLVAGAMLPIQSGINNPLKLALGNPVLPALVTFSSGALLLLLYAALLRLPLPYPGNVVKMPWWNWIGGGFCGALFVTLMITLAPRLGLAVLFALVVSGEMLMSLLLDHFGLLSFHVHALSPGRLLGAVLLIGGVTLIQRF